MQDETEYVTVTFYIPETGMIFGTRSGQKASIDLEDLPYIAGSHSDTRDYIDVSGQNPQAKLRPIMQVHQGKTTITAHGDDLMTLSGLPKPSTVMVGAEAYNVPDGVLEWATLMPGTYRIRIEAWPYLDWESEVTAVAGSAQAE